VVVVTDVRHWNVEGQKHLAASEKCSVRFTGGGNVQVAQAGLAHLRSGLSPFALGMSFRKALATLSVMPPLMK
jgi:hypothetical protein